MFVRGVARHAEADVDVDVWERIAFDGVLSVAHQDIDFERGEVTVREGKGRKDRVTMLPKVISDPLRIHLDKVRQLHEEDVRGGAGRVLMPEALRGKLGEQAASSWPWQWVFPSTRRFFNAKTREIGRHHLHESVVQREVTQAGRVAKLGKRVTCHTFRHSFATHLL